MKELAKIEMVDHGVYVEHNCPCPVCGKQRAVYQLNVGVFMPCDDCRKDGWATFKPNWLQRLVGTIDTYASTGWARRVARRSTKETPDAHP